MTSHTQRRWALVPAARDFALAHGGLVDRRTLMMVGHTYKQIRALVAQDGFEVGGVHCRFAFTVSPSS